MSIRIAFTEDKRYKGVDNVVPSIINQGEEWRFLMNFDEELASDTPFTGSIESKEGEEFDFEFRNFTTDSDANTSEIEVYFTASTTGTMSTDFLRKGAIFVDGTQYLEIPYLQVNQNIITDASTLATDASGNEYTTAPEYQLNLGVPSDDPTDLTFIIRNQGADGADGVAGKPESIDVNDVVGEDTFSLTFNFAQGAAETTGDISKATPANFTAARDAAEGFRDEAEGFKDEAETAKTAAELAETNAETAETGAEGFRDEAEGFRNEAEGFKNAAETAETNAETAETNAGTSETNAGTSETNAGTSETNAASSATSAASSVTSAETAETNAETAETNAGTSETNAAASSTSSSGFRDEAEGFRDEAEGFKDDAETAANNAGTLRGLQDTTIIATGLTGEPEAGQVLTYDDDDGWVSADATGGGSSNVTDLNSLEDVSSSSATEGQVLTLNDSDVWVPATPSTGSGGSSTLEGLTDTALDSETTGDILAYDGADWVNSADYYNSAQVDAEIVSHAGDLPDDIITLSHDNFEIVSQADFGASDIKTVQYVIRPNATNYLQIIFASDGDFVRPSATQNRKLIFHKTTTGDPVYATGSYTGVGYYPSVNEYRIAVFIDSDESIPIVDDGGVLNTHNITSDDTLQDSGELGTAGEIFGPDEDNGVPSIFENVGVVQPHEDINGGLLTLEVTDDGYKALQLSLADALSTYTVGDISDVSLATPINGQVLRYDTSGDTDRWINQDHDIHDLQDVTITSGVSDGQVLTYDSENTRWTNTDSTSLFEQTVETTELTDTNSGTRVLINDNVNYLITQTISAVSETFMENVITDFDAGLILDNTITINDTSFIITGVSLTESASFYVLVFTHDTSNLPDGTTGSTEGTLAYNKITSDATTQKTTTSRLTLDQLDLNDEDGTTYEIGINTSGNFEIDGSELTGGSGGGTTIVDPAASTLDASDTKPFLVNITTGSDSSISELQFFPAPITHEVNTFAYTPAIRQGDHVEYQHDGISDLYYKVGNNSDGLDAESDLIDSTSYILVTRSLAQLVDTTINDTPDGGQVLQFDSADNKWKPEDLPGDTDLSNYYDIDETEEVVTNLIAADIPQDIITLAHDEYQLVTQSAFDEDDIKRVQYITHTSQTQLNQIRIFLDADRISRPTSLAHKRLVLNETAETNYVIGTFSSISYVASTSEYRITLYLEADDSIRFEGDSADTDITSNTVTATYLTANANATDTIPLLFQQIRVLQPHTNSNGEALFLEITTDGFRAVASTDVKYQWLRTTGFLEPYDADDSDDGFRAYNVTYPGDSSTTKVYYKAGIWRTSKSTANDDNIIIRLLRT